MWDSTSPHDPRQSPREFVERYPQDKVAVPPETSHGEHPFDQGDARVRDELLAPFPRGGGGAAAPVGASTCTSRISTRRSGRILDALEKTGKGSETIVVLDARTTDSAVGNTAMGKQNLYEHSVRMPYVFAGPRIPKGKKIDSAGVPAFDFCDDVRASGGRRAEDCGVSSLVKTMRSDGEPHDAVFCWYRIFERSVRHPGAQAASCIRRRE